jgi:hypothetical protein
MYIPYCLSFILSGHIPSSPSAFVLYFLYVYSLLLPKLFAFLWLPPLISP